MLSITLSLNFCDLKIIHILHPRCHPKRIKHILKNKQKNKYVHIHEIIRLTHYVPILATYRNQSIDLQLTCCANFYMRATLTLNWLIIKQMKIKMKTRSHK